MARCCAGLANSRQRNEIESELKRLRAHNEQLLQSWLVSFNSAKRRIDDVPLRHPFEMHYANDVPRAAACEKCTQVLDKQDVQRALKQRW